MPIHSTVMRALAANWGMGVVEALAVGRENQAITKTAGQAVGQNPFMIHIEDLDSLGILTALPDAVSEQFSIMGDTENTHGGRACARPLFPRHATGVFPPETLS